MRLIDADELIEFLDCERKSGLALHDFSQVGSYKNAINFVENMPTAYSVDEVVGELEEVAYAHEDVNSFIDLEDAIEIVKQGGVSDDVCKWKYTKEIMDNAEFKVGCNPNALKRGVVPNNFSYHDFKYCPYCGKKIKVVE